MEVIRAQQGAIVANKKPPRRRTGAYQNGVYLGPGTPDSPPEPEPTEVTGRKTGAYQNGREIGATETGSSETQSTNSAGPTSHRKPGRIARVLGLGKDKKK